MADAEKLGIVASMYAYRQKGRIYTHTSFGRVVDRLAQRYRKVFLSVPVEYAAPDKSRDYLITMENVELIPQPFYNSSLKALKYPLKITKSYAEICQKADALFIRGMAPFVAMLYINARLHKCRVCHWIAGNPVALLKAHIRFGKVKDFLSLAYAWQDRIFTKLGRWLVGGAFVCNGKELATVFKSPRTFATVSSTITSDEFFEREDTCQGNKIRILFVGFIRPEKGVEYLIEALGKLEISSDWELTIIGTYGKYSTYKNKIESLINRYNITDKINVAGYVPYGQKMFEYFRKADLFVLPTLSEGTPRVLVEARANSLPIVATNVGGIPTSVTDGFDGLLVPPKDPVALAQAIRRVIEDGELRRSLIHNGLKSVSNMTIEHFICKVVDVLNSCNN